MEASELRKQSATELRDDLQGLLKEQFNLRMQQGTGQLARPDQMRKVRRDIARIKTVIKKKRAGEAS